MIDLILIILGGVFWRIKGGLGNETVRKLLRKPEYIINEKGEKEAWEIPNTIICGLWGLYIAAILPLTWATPLVALIVGATAKIGYLKQVGDYFGFKSGFNLADKELRSWKNYALLSCRGALILLPAALCFSSLYPQLYYGVAIGMLMPVAYLIGFALPDKRPYISHSQIAESLVGFSIVGGIL